MDDFLAASPVKSLLIDQSPTEGFLEVAQANVLIVEDENILLSYLEQVISEGGHTPSTCSSYSQLEDVLQAPPRRFDLVILDRLLHGRDSSALVPKMKDVFPMAKILIVSAVNTPAEKAALLDMGADDYMSKPFDGEELIARVRALLRRSRPELKFGNVTLNTERRTVLIADEEMALQNKEFALLQALIGNPGKVFNKGFLYQHVWKMNPDVESNAVEATVNKLRRRLEEGGATIVIKSMRNKGYWVEE